MLGDSIPYGGVAYKVRVTGCIDGTSLCGWAETKVALLDEPLQGGISGGDRITGTGNPFTIDACLSMDPDDKIARCNAGRDYCGTLKFAWTCLEWTGRTDDGQNLVGGAPTATCKLPVPSTGKCMWDVPKSALPVGKYTFGLTVT